MNNTKYIVFIPLVIWIFLWALAGYLLAYFTNINAMWIVSSLSVISIFGLIWWCYIMNKATKIDLFTKIIYLLILNIPAYFLIKIAIKKNGEIKNLDDLNASKYKLTDSKKIDYDYELMPKWEKEMIVKKQLAKELNKNTMLEEIENSPFDSEFSADIKLVLQRKIIRNFTKYVLYTVWIDQPKLTSTFTITSKVNEKFNNLKLMAKMKTEYLHNLENWNILSKADRKLLANYPNFAKNILNKTHPTELVIAYKQDRIDITIEVQAILNKV